MTDFACCCGNQHYFSPVTVAYMARVLADKGPLQTVTTTHGSWLVPRVYIAAHGLKETNVSELAETFGWQRA
jgi:hypothetical protein